MEINAVKQRFGLIGNSEGLNRAVETAMRVAPADLSVLITGESGVGKESLPAIIHANSSRKHNKYVVVNCGAIPEGTMDSELFGHVKGSFTGASSERRGYFEEADGGTIFLDEVAEMPLQTQVKLLRILESGEFMRVGSSQTQRTNVRVVAATNVNIPEAIEKGRFREDLYYRLNTVPITLPPLRERKDDIHLIFRKFASDFSEKYRTPVVRLTEDAVEVLKSYYWPGNIRQLKNITEQLSILETSREIDAPTLLKYLPDYRPNNLPATLSNKETDGLSEREILYKVMVDMRKELDELKTVVRNLVSDHDSAASSHSPQFISEFSQVSPNWTYPESNPITVDDSLDEHEEVEENLSLEEKEKELIQKALSKHNGKRKSAAAELGISERTLYRKIREYDLNE